jgi:hypothetical protein
MLLDIRIHSKYKWIAKDQCGSWFVYTDKPIIREYYWRPKHDSGPGSAHVPIEVPELKGVDWKSCCFELVDGKIKIDIKKDDPLLVRDSRRDFVKRHFHSFNVDGSINCYQNGTTSWSNENGTTTWQEWKLPENKE